MQVYTCKEHEVKSEVRPVAIDYRCEICNEGFMIATTRTIHVTTPDNSILVEHICSKCGAHMQLPKAYPRIEWEKID